MSTLPPLPRRARDAHKGTFGKLFVVAGSPGMTGAPALACEAAYRVGCGLVYLACTERLLPILSVKLTETVLIPVPGGKDGRFEGSDALAIAKVLREADAAVVGPGLSTAPGPRALVGRILPALRIPAVIDADGLNIVAENPAILGLRRSPWILTPHPGEMARLTGKSRDAVQRRRKETAAAYAKKHGCIVALKGAGTVVSDGRRSWVNDTGNPGMATGGTGDILTGLIAGLLAMGMEPWDAARLGVHLHGRAGDLAAAVLGQDSLLASDLLRFLPPAVREHRAHGTKS